MIIDRPLVAVIDSDSSSRAKALDCLVAAGLTVEVFNSAEDFLMRSETNPLHCIILDVRLPGIGGLDLQSHQTRIGRKTPLLFLTAQDEARTCV
ncbi:response regulator [Bradyrhizobium sp. USDA 313]|uniref:response regulator n=1 Tax=Bradyrhizobium TaxID=374 RepID=UPI000F540AC9|nr:response regulator [Bradyrhizobium sp. RP6]